MTGKVIDSSATGLLILILPFAVVIVLLLQAWPLLLALLIISIGLRIWQQYQWKQWSKQVNPFFNQLIKENQGCLTSLDLSIKANLSAWAATRFLDKKAEEFGAQRQVYEDKGTVYYFLTASALGSLFDYSEPPQELESDSFTSFPPKLTEALTQTPTSLPQSDSEFSDTSKPLEPSDESASSTTEVEADIEPLEVENPDYTVSLPEQPDTQQEGLKSLIQAELAKRLDVHSSTVGKRKSDPDFSEWSQSRDPERIAWEYSPETKEFLPLEHQQ